MTKLSAVEIVQKKFERKAQLKEQELDLRKMELELQSCKLDQEGAMGKQKQEERRNDCTLFLQIQTGYNLPFASTRMSHLCIAMSLWIHASADIVY